MSICNTTTLNCALWKQGRDDRRIRADPDIAGIGVVAAFVVNTLITLLVAHASFVLGVVRGYEDNPLDTWLFDKLQHIRPFRAREERTKFWNPIIEDLILSLSDQQLLIGISILTAGFIQHCSISVYHFTIVSDLAWFSSTTHMTTMSVLRVRFNERPSLRDWRVGLMIPMALLLVASLIFKGHQHWDSSWKSPAHCLFSDLPGNFSGQPSQWSMAMIFVVFFGYIDVIHRLYDSDFLDELLFGKPMRMLRRAQSAIGIVRFVRGSKRGAKAFMAIAMLLPLQSLLLVAEKILFGAKIFNDSIIANLMLEIAWFVWGVWSLNVDRYIPPNAIQDNENVWGFGQIVPILLLSSIILTTKELVTGEYNHLEAGIFNILWSLNTSNAEQTAKLNRQAKKHDRDNGLADPPDVDQRSTGGDASPVQDAVPEEPGSVLIPPRRVDTEAGRRR